MNLVIELLNREKEFIANLKSCNNADEQELQMLAEIDKALELLQSCVVRRSEQLADFCKKVAKQQDCPEEFQEIVNKEFWNLIS